MVQQRGILLFFQDAVDEILTLNKGHPALSLNHLILRFCHLPNLPEWPTLNQMRSRAQQLNVHRGTNFETNADILTWARANFVPARDVWETMDRHQPFVLSIAHDSEKGHCITMSTKAVRENFKQEVFSLPNFRSE